MKKSAERGEIMMKSEMQSELITEPEMDAALQLIQLSGDSMQTGVYIDTAETTVELSREESVGDSNEISSYAKVGGEIEALPRRKKRFRLIDDIYSVTSPAANKRGKKSARR